MRLNRLKALDVTRSKLKPGMHADGGGLYLRVARGGSKQWIFRYRKADKLVDMGLGGVAAVSLAMARSKATAARSLLTDGRDPLFSKQAQKAAEARGVTFEAAAEQCVAEGGVAQCEAFGPMELHPQNLRLSTYWRTARVRN